MSASAAATYNALRARAKRPCDRTISGAHDWARGRCERCGAVGP